MHRRKPPPSADLGFRSSVSRTSVTSLPTQQVHCAIRAALRHVGRRTPPDHSTLETMNTQEAKVVLEAALLTSEQPLSVAELRRLFNDELNADTIRVLLDELRTDWNGRGVELAALATGWRFQSAPLMRPVPRAPQPGASAEVFARGARDACDHCLSPAGHARRHRGDPRRHGLDQRDQDARGSRLGRSDRPSRNARPSRAVRDDQGIPRRPRPAFPRGTAGAGVRRAGARRVRTAVRRSGARGGRTTVAKPPPKRHRTE